MNLVTIMFPVREFPTTQEARTQIAREACREVLDAWRDAGWMRAGQTLNMYVYDPARYGPSTPQRIHRGDQAHAMAANAGGVPVAVTVTNGELDPQFWAMELISSRDT